MGKLGGREEKLGGVRNKKRPTLKSATNRERAYQKGGLTPSARIKMFRTVHRKALSLLGQSAKERELTGGKESSSTSMEVILGGGRCAGNEEEGLGGDPDSANTVYRDAGQTLPQEYFDR